MSKRKKEADDLGGKSPSGGVVITVYRVQWGYHDRAGLFFAWTKDYETITDAVGYFSRMRDRTWVPDGGSRSFIEILERQANLTEEGGMQMWGTWNQLEADHDTTIPVTASDNVKALATIMADPERSGTEKRTAMKEALRYLVDKADEEHRPGKDSDTGRVCPRHKRWVAWFQTSDPCFKHCYGKEIAELEGASS